MVNRKLSRACTGLMLIDVQEKLMPYMQRSDEILAAMHKAIQAFQILGLPIIVTEQYPAGLGPTVASLSSLLGHDQLFLPKSTFSGLASANIIAAVESTKVIQWVLIGIEAHICVQQTAKGLLAKGMEVTVLNDATSSRTTADCFTAIQHMRDSGISISSVEAVLFELLHDSQAPEFKAISKLIK